MGSKMFGYHGGLVKVDYPTDCSLSQNIDPGNPGLQLYKECDICGKILNPRTINFNPGKTDEEKPNPMTRVTVEWECEDCGCNYVAVYPLKAILEG